METTNAKWNITRNLNFYYRETTALPWTEMEVLRWPLVVGKSWAFTNPMPDGINFEWQAKVDRWEEVNIPAGRFKAVVVQIEGRHDDYWQTRTIWYAPETKSRVKEEWWATWRGIRAGGGFDELESFTLH